MLNGNNNRHVTRADNNEKAILRQRFKIIGDPCDPHFFENTA